MAFSLSQTNATFSTLNSWHEIGEAAPHFIPTLHPPKRQPSSKAPPPSARPATPQPSTPSGNRTLTPRPWSAPKCTTIPVFGYADDPSPLPSSARGTPPWVAAPRRGVSRGEGRRLGDPRYGDVLGGFGARPEPPIALAAEARLPSVLGLAKRAPRPPLLQVEPPTQGRQAWSFDTSIRVGARRGWGVEGAAWDQTAGATDHLGRQLEGAAAAPDGRRGGGGGGRTTPRHHSSPLSGDKPGASGGSTARRRVPPAPVFIDPATRPLEEVWAVAGGAPRPSPGEMSVGACFVFSSSRF